MVFLPFVLTSEARFLIKELFHALQKTHGTIKSVKSVQKTKQKIKWVKQLSGILWKTAWVKSWMNYSWYNPLKWQINGSLREAWSGMNGSSVIYRLFIHKTQVMLILASWWSIITTVFFKHIMLYIVFPKKLKGSGVFYWPLCPVVISWTVNIYGWCKKKKKKIKSIYIKCCFSKRFLIFA